MASSRSPALSPAGRGISRGKYAGLGSSPQDYENEEIALEPQASPAPTVSLTSPSRCVKIRARGRFWRGYDEAAGVGYSSPRVPFEA